EISSVGRVVSDALQTQALQQRAVRPRQGRAADVPERRQHGRSLALALRQTVARLAARVVGDAQAHGEYELQPQNAWFGTRGQVLAFKIQRSRKRGSLRQSR